MYNSNMQQQHLLSPSWLPQLQLITHNYQWLIFFFVKVFIPGSWHSNCKGFCFALFCFAVDTWNTWSRWSKYNKHYLFLLKNSDKFIILSHITLHFIFPYGLSMLSLDTNQIVCSYWKWIALSFVEKEHPHTFWTSLCWFFFSFFFVFGSKI